MAKLKPSLPKETKTKLIKGKIKNYFWRIVSLAQLGLLIYIASKLSI